MKANRKRGFDWMAWAAEAARAPFDAEAWVKELKGYGISVHRYVTHEVDGDREGFFIGLADRHDYSLKADKALALTNVGDTKARKAAVLEYLRGRK